MEHTSTIIPKAIHALGPKAEREYYMHWVLWHWADIVGVNFANHVTAMGIRNKVLYVSCDDSTWSNETRMMSPMVIQKVNNYAGQAMVKEIHFVRPREQEKIEKELLRARLASLDREELDVGKARRKIAETEDDVRAAQEMTAAVEDKDLSQVLRGLYRKDRQLTKLRLEKSWHPCRNCGRLCEPQKALCSFCQAKEEEKLRLAVRTVLRDIPWARCSEVREYVPECTPKLLNEQRAIMVQQLASKVEFNDTTSLKAKNLVMLYLCLPPDQLNDEVMKRAIYDLRFNLHRPKDYRAPKRYDVIPLRHAQPQRKTGNLTSHKQKG